MINASEVAECSYLQLGDALFNADCNGIEHFGYVDGRSQPLMLKEDIDQEPHDEWDPSIPLSQIIVADPAGEGDVSCGSYFVFRKLHQNVSGFKKAEEQLAKAAGIVDDQRAGASLVGRFENGTPVIASRVAGKVGAKGETDNDFNYSGDPQGFRCPYAAHIRKTNPRTDDTKRHLMARRGIPYGLRQDDPNDENGQKPGPEAEVGLLFMSYQSDLQQGFEFTQKLWADNPDFDFASPTQPVGIDPIIGQGENASNRYPKVWGHGPLTDAIEFGRYVTMKGGEYFFAPSRSFFEHRL